MVWGVCANVGNGIVYASPRPNINRIIMSGFMFPKPAVKRIPAFPVPT